MGAWYKAHCVCGYEADAHTGATRATHRTSFVYPHACRRCGEIISPEMVGGGPSCPTCASTDLHHYGAKVEEAGRQPKTVLSRIWTKLHPPPKETEAAPDLDVVDRTFNVHSGATWELRGGPHWCPKCGAASVRFRLVALYD